MQGIATHFTGWDWLVVVLYLGATTWVGHALRGRQANMRDFFMAGRRLPWPAVSGSMIATEISALTFIGVPGMVFAAGGDFTYLQWALGSILARCIVGMFLVRRYYAEEIYSPYDYMGLRLGNAAKQVTTVLFFLGAMLGQSVRLLVTALILRTVTGMDFHLCILLIGLFAVGWTWMGGMATVIWTDVVQFFLFLFGGVLALVWICVLLPGGWGEVWEVGQEAGKFRLWDLTTDPAVQFTLWVALLAMPFQNLAAFGTDQLNAQRMFCCRDAADACKAVVASSVSQLVTVLMMMVGVALFVYYEQFGMSAAEQAAFAEDKDFVFPVWITTVLPAGLAGLVLAGAFAAAISSLDSVLTALAQTSLSLRYGTKGLAAMGDGRGMVWKSRLLVLFWGVVLAFCAIGLDRMRGDINLIGLAFGMVAYTYGPLLGILFLALTPLRVRAASLWAGVVASVMLAAWARPEIYVVLSYLGVGDWSDLRPTFAFPWLYPMTCLLTLGIGLIGARKSSGSPT